MYHAHVYFTLLQAKAAEEFRSKISAERDDVTEVFPLVKRLVGPHKLPMFELNFVDNSQGIIEWLDENRGQFDVLVHPVTGDDIVDHSDSAVWLGRELGVFEDKL